MANRVMVEGLPTDIKDVFQSLDREILSADNLLALLDRELEALKIMDIQTLAAVSQRKTKQVEQMRQLDQTLATQVRQCLKRAGVVISVKDDSDVPLTALSQVVNRDLKEKIDSYRQQLSKKRNRITDCNHINKKLVTDSLAYFSDAVSLITGTISETVGYGRPRDKSSRKGPAFISKAV